MFSVILCRTAARYTLYGYSLKSQPLSQNLLFSQTEAPEDSPHNITLSKTELIAKGISQGFTIDLLLQNFIASIIVVYDENYSSRIAQCLLIAIVVNTVLMTYTQRKLIINGFIQARAGQVHDDAVDIPVLTKNQIQALIGFLSSIEACVRWYFSVLVVFNSSNVPLKQAFAIMAGIGRGGAFFMTSGHAACDVEFGRTIIGQFVYGFLTSPIMPKYIEYINSVSPIVMGAVLFSAIITTADALCVENPALLFLSFIIASSSGMMGFLMQKYYTCSVIKKNLIRNESSINQSNKFWYGEADNANIFQTISCAIKRFVELTTVLPLFILDIIDKAITVICYVVLAILPIQIVALSQYIAYPAFTYWVYYQFFHNIQGMTKMYTGKNISALSSETQYLLTLIAIPFGLASAFTMLNLTGESILTNTNTVFSSHLPNTRTDLSDTTFLTRELGDQSTVYTRCANTLDLAKKSAKDAYEKCIKQIRGRI